MTRDEFMKVAQNEIDQIFLSGKNRMMNLVERAWAEGKKNAEVDNLKEVLEQALENCFKKEDKEELENECF